MPFLLELRCVMRRVTPHSKLLDVPAPIGRQVDSIRFFQNDANNRITIWEAKAALIFIPRRFLTFSDGAN